MKKAIQFGAGNIGRGFIGALLAQADYHVTFADVNQAVIDKINEDKEYSVHILDKEIEKQKITNISACHVASETLLEEIKEAEIITTAVGPVVLSKIAATLAEGIRRRMKNGSKVFLNIIACENMVGASQFLKAEVLKNLDAEEAKYLEEYVGFPNSAVDRIVPPSQAAKDNILLVEVESFHEWIVDGTQFKGEIPEIKGMQITDRLIAFVERKLYTLNTGHAITSYFGYLKGYETISESIEDKDIYANVKGAMEESGAALVKKHDFDPELHAKYINKILNRFTNPYLKDDVLRVGREPLRKLGKEDRLVKPMLMALEYDIKPEKLILGAGAALHYTNESDGQSVELQKMIKEQGLESTIEKVTGISNQDIVKQIALAYEKVK